MSIYAQIISLPSRQLGLTFSNSLCYYMEQTEKTMLKRVWINGLNYLDLRDLLFVIEITLKTGKQIGM